MIPFLLTGYAGFTHAFETDHLLAVGNIVSNRQKFIHAIKDGLYWGLGHTSTILAIGLMVIVFRMNINERIFGYFEAAVGVMLIVLAVFRLVKLWRKKEQTALHVHADGTKQEHSHRLAYGVGLVHGIAGSGALVVVVVAQMKTSFDGLMYLLIFGLGSAVGMLVAAALFCVPFSRKVIQSGSLQTILILLSSSLCILYGAKVVYENLLK
jgi:high-affinity nickel permease